jgi:hypothetical protein
VFGEVRGLEFVSGQRGTGKTTYIRERILAREPRLFIYDHMAEFNEPGFATFYKLDQAIDFMDQNRSGLCRLTYKSLEPSPEEFATICRVPFCIPDLVIVVDELDTFAGAVTPRPPDEFRQLVHFGRHVGCGIVGASRRPADVSRAFTSQAKRYVCFRQTEPSDLRFLRSVLGPEADRIKDLPPLHYLAFEDGRRFAGIVDPT